MYYWKFPITDRIGNPVVYILFPYISSAYVHLIDPAGRIMTMSVGSLIEALVFFFCLLSITTVCGAVDTLSTGQTIRGNETVISANGSFELGFWSPSGTENRYLCIWYKEISVKTIVWVANRNTPLAKSTGTLQLTNKGILQLLDHNERVIWFSNSSRLVQNLVAQLLDSGNLVVMDPDDKEPEKFIWQSFNNPGNTLLPEMKLGRNITTGVDRYLTSWKSSEDPSPGNFTYILDPNGYPQLIMFQGSDIKFRRGSWNGLRFTGAPNTKENPIFKFDFVFNEEEMYYYYTYKVHDSSLITRKILNSDGGLQRFVWIDQENDWQLYLTGQIDYCDGYALCGPYGSCDVATSPVCNCLTGFVAKFPQEWERLYWSNGCVRRTHLNCTEDVFMKYSGLKLPDTRTSRYNKTMNLGECKTICKKNCNCTAYANLDIRDGGSGCLLWFGDLVDIREYSENGQDIYIRMSASEADKIASEQKKNKQVVIIVSVLGGLILMCGLVLIRCIVAKRYNSEASSITQSQKEDIELPLFDFQTVAAATNSFSVDNKLGEGGFGPVYKGMLKDGKEIAVKMLSRNSNQGFDEFKNEVICIAKLQHRNLVKLLGCCIQEEHMLLYEYMSNKSLDFLIFDHTQRKLLNWKRRSHIINGVAKGLLYLHEDSRLRIIHRDLKASNILLDNEMNPKISDFGLARSFGGNETEAATKRVVGTYGYMSPEYAIDGIFSIKSDVFSYGVLVLEIVSGKKNRGFYHPDHYHNLLGHAWKMFKEGRSLEMMDDLIVEPRNLFEMLRLIHIGLLCVQRSPEDRPNMSTVVLMLSSDITLPQAKEPGFFTEREVFKADMSSSKNGSYSLNELSMSMLSAR